MKNATSIFIVYLFMLLVTANVQAEQCFPLSSWTTPIDMQQQVPSEILHSMSGQKLLFLGEHHANEQHHQWQLEVLQKITQQGQWALGLESFPRRQQKTLDEWINKTISYDEFIRKVGWDDFWSFPSELYRPILELARERNIPLIALNVDRELIRKTGHMGWENIPGNEREGVNNPNPPDKAYVRRLAISFQKHNTHEIGDETKQHFRRFVEQQLLWDTAMAQAINDAHQAYPDRQIVSIIGSWHLIEKLGVPYQLKSLWQQQSYVAIPWDENLNCHEITGEYADVIYTPSQL